MRVFISYASEDRDKAEQIYLALVASNHKVFFDRENISPSSNYNKILRNSIWKSDFFIFLISSNSISDGSYTLTELKFARDKWHRPQGSVLPIILRKTSFDLIPNYLKSVSILEPEGNIAAEVVYEVNKQAKQRIVSFFKKSVVLSIALAITVISLARFEIFADSWQIRNSTTEDSVESSKQSCSVRSNSQIEILGPSTLYVGQRATYRAEFQGDCGFSWHYTQPGTLTDRNIFIELGYPGQTETLTLVVKTPDGREFRASKLITAVAQP